MHKILCVCVCMSLVGVLPVTFNKHFGLPHSRLSSQSDDYKSILPFPCTVVISLMPRLSTLWCLMPGLHHQVRSAGGRSRWLYQWCHWRIQLPNPKRSKWDMQDVKSEWVIRVGTGVKKLLYVGDVFVMSPPSSAYISSSSFYYLCTKTYFSSLHRKPGPSPQT